jgi:ABC-type transport system involved in multi-copper enzyme maturation permease subunit
MIDSFWQKWRWDGLGMGLAGLCMVHCLLASMLLLFLASAGGALFNPAIHEIGLLLATILGALAFAKGLAGHGLFVPAVVGGSGIIVMVTALTMPHGLLEMAVTVIGMILLGAGHYLNHQALKQAGPSA